MFFKKGGKIIYKFHLISHFNKDELIITNRSIFFLLLDALMLKKYVFSPVNLHNNTTLCLRCFSLKYQLTLWARFQVWEHRQPELLDSSLPQSRYWKHGEWVKKSQKTFFSDMKYIFSIIGEDIAIESTFWTYYCIAKWSIFFCF